MTTAIATPAPRYYVASWSARTGQRISARIVDSAIAAVVVVLVLVAGPHGRPFAQDLVILALVTAVEATSITRFGATAGMRAVGLRVAPIGRTGNPTWLQAFRRTVPIAMCSMILLPGTLVALVMPFVLLVSISLSPLRQAFHDRLSETLVVADGAPPCITRDMLDLWWDPSKGATMTPWGRVPDLHERRRARAHRLDGAWWLAGAIVIATIASVGMPHVPWLVLWLALAWMVVLVADETWRLAATGTTPGHAAMGFRVVDLTTGEPPSTGRALARSLVLAPLLYVPPLQLILAFWVQASALNRGPHDLAGHTVVVEPGYVAPQLRLPPAPVWAGWAPAAPGWMPPAPGWAPPTPGWAQPVPGWMPPAPGWAPPTPGRASPTPGWAPPGPGWAQPPPRGVPPPPRAPSSRPPMPPPVAAPRPDAQRPAPGPF